MAQASDAGRAGRGRNGRRGDRGRGGCRGTPLGTVPRKASEVGACKDLEGHIFTIGSGNKGKDRNMLRTSMEKMATYIGTKYSNKAAQEWTSDKKIILQEPAYLQAILVRHAERVKATRERIQLRFKSLRAEKMAIKDKLISAPTNCGLLKELREVDDQIAKGDIKLKDEVEMKLTNDEKTVHSKAWHTHRESSNSLKKSRGKIYSLLLGQCTQVLVDKMKQDVDWVKISGSFNPTLLFKLIKKFVLKQSDNQYKTAVLIDEQLSILSFRQDDQVGNATYYDWFTTRVEVACQAGVCYHSPDLLEDKAAQLNMAAYDTLLPAKKKAVVDVVEQEYLAYLFINNSNAKMHSQLKKDVANNYYKGNMDSYSKDTHKALTLMNEYKPLKLDAQVIPAQGTAFVTGGQGGKGRKGAKYLQDAEWNALSPEAKFKIIEAHKKGAKGGEDNDDKSSLSAKLAKTIKSLSKTTRLLERDNKKLRKSVSALQKCNKDDDNDSSISTVEGSSHFQDALEILKEHHSRIVLALKHGSSWSWT
jgi:hypothetical protein